MPNISRYISAFLICILLFKSCKPIDDSILNSSYPVLNGNPHKEISRIYTYDKTDSKKDSVLIGVTHNYYDENGRLKSNFRLNKFKKDTTGKMYLSYNDLGKTSSWERYARDGHLIASHEFRYDKKGRLIIKYRNSGFNIPSEHIYYNHRGRFIYYSSPSESRSRKMGQTFVYEFKQNSKLKKSVSLDLNGEPIYSSRYKYNNDGMLESKTSLDSVGKISIVNYLYDNLCNQIERRMITILNNDTIFKRRFSFDYKYDSVGNPIRIKEYMDGKLSSITFNEIQYRN